MTATLRLGVHAGMQLATPDFSIAGIHVTKFSTGLEIGVFADLAEFTTTFNESLTNNGTTCDFMGEQTYQLALGADAGATLALGHHTWGPAPTSTMPLFYTTLSSACLGNKPTSTSPPALTVSPSPSSLSKRQDDSASSTTTLTTKVTYTAVQCPTGSPLCPVSQQTTSVATRTSTLVTVLPSGSEATFPPTTVAAVSTTIPFGRSAQSIFSSSGSPVSYVPPPPPTSTAPAGGPGGGGGGVDGFFGIAPEGLTQTQKIIIGVTVGVGVPLLIGLIAGIIL
jgi:hypothetical protein